MTNLTNPVPALLVGFAFGWILQRAELSRYHRIAGVFRLRDLTVLKFLGSALVTSAIGIALLRTLGLAVAPVPVPATYALGNLLGGVVFGVGMALSGFCPGTIAAGVGEGRLDYLVPGALGLYTGAVIYGLAYDRVMPVVARGARSITLPQLLDVEPWLVVLLLAELALLGFYALTPRSGRPAAYR